MVQSIDFLCLEQLKLILTVMVDGVDEPDANMCMVVRHQNNVEQFFTLRIQLPQTIVDRFQSLSGYSKKDDMKTCTMQVYKCFTRFFPWVGMCLCAVWGDFDLDKGESRSGGKGFVLMFNLVSQILFNALLLEHPLLFLSSKQHPRWNCNGYCVFWLGLQIENKDGIKL